MPGAARGVRKTVHIVDPLPKKLTGEAKEKRHDIWIAETRNDANTTFDRLLDRYGAKYEKARPCLKNDHSALLNLNDFPAEHGRHLRAAHLIESSFATIRHRANQTKGGGSRLAPSRSCFKSDENAKKTAVASTVLNKSKR